MTPESIPLDPDLQHAVEEFSKIDVTDPAQKDFLEIVWAQADLPDWKDRVLSRLFRSFTSSGETLGAHVRNGKYVSQVFSCGCPVLFRREPRECGISYPPHVPESAFIQFLEELEADARIPKRSRDLHPSQGPAFAYWQQRYRNLCKGESVAPVPSSQSA